MPLVKSGTFGGSPSAYYEIHADLLGGSGNTRQVKVHLALKVNGGSSSYYGYPLNWLPKIHTSNGGWQHVKGSERWNGSEGLRWYSWTATVDVGTTSSTSIGVGFDLRRSDGGSTNWNTSQSGSFNVGSTNTAPWMNGGVTIRAWDANGPVLNGYYPENVSTLHLSWQAGSDNEQGSSGLRYGVNQIVNGGGATTILYPTTSTSCTAGIGAGGEGQRLKYYVDCRDNSDALSGNRADSPEIVKNTLTPAGFTGHSNNIAFDSPSFTLYYGGANNTDGSACNFLIYSDTVTIYNGTASTSGTQKIDIWRSGATPSGPYIKFDDLKNKFANSSYNGSIHVGLRTGNSYGTYKYAGGSVGVDLRTAPNPATQQVISTNPSESTMYKKIAFANNYYFLPDGNLVARIKWASGSGKLGEAISYEIYVAYGGGSWQKIADINGSGVHYDHVISKQSISQQFKYLIRTKNVYGYYSDAVTSSENLHYYNQPSITVGQINRTETTAEIPVTIKTISSIPNISTVGTYTNTTLGGDSVNLSPTQGSQNLIFSGLTGNGTYTVSVIFNDNTGFSDNQSRAIAIGANLPVMFLNKYGLGVGGTKANGNQVLVVNGTIGQNGGAITDFDTVLTEGKYYFANDALNSPITGYGRLMVTVNDGGTHNNTNNWVWQTVYTTNNQEWRRQKINSGGWTAWVLCYDSSAKPSASDVGALPITGGTLTGHIACSGYEKTIQMGVGANDGYIVNTRANRYLQFLDGGALNYTSTFSSTANGTGYDAPVLQMKYSNGNIAGNFTLTGDTLSLHRYNTSGVWTSYLRFHADGAIQLGDGFLINNGGASSLRVKNSSGFVDIGPQNTSHCHYQTDRPSHWFNKEVRVQGDVLHGSSYNNNYTHGTNWKIQGFDNANSEYLHCATSVGAFGISWWASDVRLKNNIAELTGKTDYIETIDKDKVDPKRQYSAFSALETIKKIEHFSFNMLSSDSRTSCGYIANQLQEINDEFVMEVKQDPTVKKYDKETDAIIDVPNPMYFEDDPVIRNPKSSALIPYITKAIQEQQEIIEQLMKRIEELEAK